MSKCELKRHKLKIMNYGNKSDDYNNNKVIIISYNAKSC